MTEKKDIMGYIHAKDNSFAVKAQKMDLPEL